jgi:UDP-glucose 4-epimerase
MLGRTGRRQGRHMRVLVTGGAGYIGSHAARELARNGHSVLIYDNLSTGHRFLAKGFELVEADLRDSAAAASALRGVDAVMHFAAHAYVGESVQNPRKYFENNVQSALSFLNVAVDAGLKHFIFSSTCAVYGVPREIPIAETTPREPVNPYGATKLLFENALEAYSEAYGLRSVRLRYFNAAGADASGEIGELHDPEPHLIPCTLQAAAGLRHHLDIYGSDYPTPDGTCIRDYIHVTDLAKAHVRALEYLASGGPSTALNLGTGEGHSVLELVSVAEEISGRAVPRQLCPRRPGDPPVLVANASRAYETLKWKPSLSIRDIVSSAWNWMQVSARR